jgi:hypothetical protein
MAEHGDTQIEPFELIERAQDALEEGLAVDLEQRFGLSSVPIHRADQSAEAHDDSPSRRAAAERSAHGSHPRAAAAPHRH